MVKSYRMEHNTNIRLLVGPTVCRAKSCAMENNISIGFLVGLIVCRMKGCRMEQIPIIVLLNRNSFILFP
jgi:hypothetical protein